MSSEISENFRQRVRSCMETIKSSEKPVIVFGAGRAGWYIMKVLEHHGVPIAAFSDNDPRKQSTFHGYPVLSPVDAYRWFPDALVFLGIFVPGTAAAVQRQFYALNYENVYFEMPAFLFSFLATVVRRSCDEHILAKSIQALFDNYTEGSIHYGYTKNGCLVSPFVTSVITQNCTLRCRDCAQFIPYYKTPVHFHVESIIADLKEYAKAFDLVPEISLHGGEPFLHPGIQEICREVAAIPNIVFISFVTNGTILPPEDTLKEMSACGVDVHQSGGYGRLSRKQASLFEAFHRHNIYSDILFCSPTEKWVQPPPFRKHGRSFSANDELYRKCVGSKTCCQIMDGELHRCAVSMHGMHQDRFPRFEEDFVNLQEPHMSEGALTAKIREFLTRDRALCVCDYCDPSGGVCVEPAIQLPLQQPRTGHSHGERA
jgi:hypothetical protein